MRFIVDVVGINRKTHCQCPGHSHAVKNDKFTMYIVLEVTESDLGKWGPLGGIYYIMGCPQSNKSNEFIIIIIIIRNLDAVSLYPYERKRSRSKFQVSKNKNKNYHYNQLWRPLSCILLREGRIYGGLRGLKPPPKFSKTAIITSIL